MYIIGYSNIISREAHADAEAQAQVRVQAAQVQVSEVSNNDSPVVVS